MIETLFQRSVTLLEKLTPLRNLSQRVPAIRYILSCACISVCVCVCIYIYLYVMGSYTETILMVVGCSQLQVEFSFLSFNIQTCSVNWKLQGSGPGLELVHVNRTLLDQRVHTIHLCFLPPMIWLFKMQHLWNLPKFANMAMEMSQQYIKFLTLKFWVSISLSMTWRKRWGAVSENSEATPTRGKQLILFLPFRGILTGRRSGPRGTL